MKSLIISALLILGISDALLAQQLPLYSNFFRVQQFYNPAVVGLDSVPDAFFLYRNQWVGITGAPESQVFGIESPLMKGKLGIGATVYNETSNIIGRTGEYVNFAYHMALDSMHLLHFGMAIGVVQNRILFDRIDALDPTESALLSSGQTRTKLDGSFGLYYEYDKKLKIGASSLQLFNSEYTYSIESEEEEVSLKLLRHYYFSGSYVFESIGKYFSLTPQAIVRSTQSLPIQWDLGVQSTYKDFVTLGAMYRSNYGISTSVGFKLSNAISLGYAYDIPVNGLLEHTKGSHELVANLRIFKGKGSKHTKPVMDEDALHEHEELEERVVKLRQHVDTLYDKVADLKNEAELHSLQLDSLIQMKLALQSRVDSNQLAIEDKNQELINLREAIKRSGNKGHDFYETEHVMLENETDSLDNRRYDYYVVVNTYEKKDYAKFLKGVLKREYDLDAQVMQSGTDKNVRGYYLVYTKKVYTKQEASMEIAKLKAVITLDYVTRDDEYAWLYHKPKNIDWGK